MPLVERLRAGGMLFEAGPWVPDEDGADEGAEEATGAPAEEGTGAPAEEGGQPRDS